VLLLFAATLFVSAFLLFLVQPLIAQMILPLLGGTPAVWNTCMVFFQAALLAGYAYTHSATTYMPAKRQTLMQGGLLVLPFLLFLLPFSLGDWTPATEVNPIWSVLYVLLLVVGLPFFIVATSAPLLQRWFSSTGHPAAKDPYFLYGASNLGSMLALLSYPFFFQRVFELPEMATVWMIGYAALVVLVGICGFVVWRAPLAAGSLAPGESPGANHTQPAPMPVARHQVHVTRRPLRQRAKPVVAAVQPAVAKDIGGRLTWPRRLRWIGLAAAPSSLMLGLTTYVTTDIAATPLFWIVPLALYLLSFILVFARWPVPWTGTPHRLFVYFQPVMMMGLALLLLAGYTFRHWGLGDEWIVLANLAAFFVCAMVCHGELAKDRPSAQHLTEFYLWMSVGGVLGGLFNSMIAPLVFKQVIEYTLVLVLVLFLRPQTHFWLWLFRKPELADDHSWQEYLLDIGYAACLGLLGYALLRLSQSERFWANADNFTQWLHRRYVDLGMDKGTSGPWKWAYWTELLVIKGIPFGILLCFAGRPLRLGLGVIGLFLVSYWMLSPDDSDIIYRNRSFFSVQRVARDEAKYGTYNVLYHGGIDHGRQNIDPALRDRPISYFYPANPVGQVFTQLKRMDSNPPYAVVGLGTGTLASYGNKGQVVDFYEIDPAVRDLSERPDGSEPFFWYLQDAKRKRGVQLNVILGDGRLKLQKAAPDFYQVIVLDAFSSDAIPVHLMTTEAIKMYLTKLKKDGILVFNITNRYVRLAPVLADAAKELDLMCLEQGDSGDDNPEHSGSDWVILFRKKDPKQMVAEAVSVVSALQPGAMSSVPWAGIAAAPKLELPSGLPQRLDPWRWEQPEPTGRPAWTDSYQDLIRAMVWYESLMKALNW